MALGIQVDVDVHSGKLERDAVSASSPRRCWSSYPNLKMMAITLRESKSASHNGWSACLHNRSEFLLSRHYEITHIVDRVGGGDCFAGGLDLRAADARSRTRMRWSLRWRHPA